MLSRARAVSLRVQEMLRALYTGRNASAVQRLSMLDTVSQTLCEEIDRAELLRFVHPSSAVREESNAVFETLAHLIAQLNTSTELYRVASEIVAEGGDFDEEQMRVAVTYKSELEAHGVHLGQDVQQQVVDLQVTLC
jgi:Zn-dependent oligopeptidase